MNKKIATKFMGLMLGLVLLLSSCGGSGQDVKYIAVKTVDSELWSIMDVKTGEIVHKDEFKSSPSTIHGDVFWVMNAEGKYDVFKVGNVTKPINSEPYKYISTFDDDGYALATKSGQAITIIDESCNVIAELPSNIVRAEAFINGYSLITDTQDQKGFMDHTGKIIIDPKYDNARDFYDGVAIVGMKASDDVCNYSAIDTKGTVLFTFTSGDYDGFSHFSEGMLAVSSDEQVFLIDKQGNKGIQVGKNNEYEVYNAELKKGMIVFSDGSSYGLKDSKGEVLIRPKYDALGVLENGYLLAKKQDQFGIVDKEDNIIVPFEHKILHYINSERYLFGNDKNANLVDTKGQDVGKNNIINLSAHGKYYVKSNFFDVETALNKIFDVVGNDHVGRAKAGMTLDDFRDLLSGYKYLDSEKSHLEERINGQEVSYIFERTLSHETYRYIYGYRFSDGKDYDYKNPLFAALTAYSVKEFEGDAEVKLTEAIESRLSSLGFNNNEDGVLKNDNGYSVSVGYDNGVVSISYVFSDSSVKMDRKGRTNAVVEPEGYNYLGLDNTKKD